MQWQPLRFLSTLPFPRFPRFMLSIQAIIKKFGAFTALDAVSLEIASGEFFGLLGPNGTGKTTLMSLIAGLRAPDSGAISSGANGGKRNVALGLVPQVIALYADLILTSIRYCHNCPFSTRDFPEHLSIFGKGGNLGFKLFDDFFH
jgi:ABC-type Mn2+/Zn2+ transport system ATPase subunit